MPKNTTSQDSIKLLRHQLASVDLSDIPVKDLTESESKEYAGVISTVFPRLEKDIKKFLHEQLLFASNEAETWEQVIFARGTFNGMSLLLNYWKAAHLEHQGRTKEPAIEDENNPINEM